jgi:hypothetical protein
LREACKSYQYSISNGLISVPNGKITEALALPSDDTALREYGANLVERIASMLESMGLVGNEGYYCADKIREWKF